MIDYTNTQSVNQTKEKLHDYAKRLIVKSGYYSLSKMMQISFKELGNPFNYLHFNRDLDKIYLGLGMEFLMKALYLHKGHVIHKVNNNARNPIRIENLQRTDNIDYDWTISFNHLKNNIHLIINNNIQTYTEALTIIQNWRNGLVHQAIDPGEENSAQWLKIQNTIAEFHNRIIEDEN